MTEEQKLTNKERQKIEEERELERVKKQLNEEVGKFIPKGKKEKIMVGVLCLICIFTLVFVFSSNGNGEPIQLETNQSEQNKAMRILQEQKERAEETTRTAVNLITEDKMSEIVALYNDRWNEIAQLRVDVMYDKELTGAEKKNIDQALEVEQEGITNILSKYQQLY